MKYNVAWINLNRSCNLRCQWCYCKDTNFQQKFDMKLDTAFKIIDICSDLKIKKIILIGGEPTVYPYIKEVIKYAKQKFENIVLVSNGLAFKNVNVLKEYISLGISQFGISLKAYNKKLYEQLTRVDAFDDFIEAIDNLVNENARFSISNVLDSSNYEQLLNCLSLLKEHGAKNFGFSFCYNFNCDGISNKDYLKNNNPFKLASSFFEYYPKIKNELDGCNFSLMQSLPECAWNEESIKNMVADGKIKSICQVLSGGGILFDTNGDLIPCNAMYKLVYGKFGVDFCDSYSLLHFLESDKVNKLFEKLRALPDKECLSCNKVKHCGGGCVLNWTNYDFKRFKELQYDK